ncbi:MAG: methyltransferase domain-containing protein [Proteobacteria bacterium]|nr:methyltransferase domain-containing protein [Pseudomonadota bacterium]
MDPAFFLLHQDLLREGPGDRDTLDRALAPANLRPDAVICDAGCGPGGDVEGLLAHAPRGRVLAVDTHAPFIEQVRARFGGDPRVEARAESMADQQGPFDLIWCAGALYFLGVRDGLRTFRGSLVPDGLVAFSAPAWFVEEPSDTARAFWDGEDAAVFTRDTLLAEVRAAGFEPIVDFSLSDAAWESYFGPIDERIARLRPTADAALHAVLDMSEREAQGWRAVRKQTGYQQVLARRV